jgi:hypothetical protein
MDREKKCMFMAAIIAISIFIMGLSIAVGVDVPPSQPVKIQGNVLHENGTRVSAGWLVTAIDMTVSVTLGNDTTDFPPITQIPQYQIKVDPSLIVVDHNIRVEVRNGNWYGEGTHAVQSGENALGAAIIMGDIIVTQEANATSAGISPGLPIVTTPKPTPAAAATPTEAPTPTPEEPGFEAIFAIAGLLAITHIVLRRKR